MKKIGLILLCVLMLCGCKKTQSLESKQFDIYNTLKSQLSMQKQFDKESGDFTIQVLFQKRETDYRYDVIIDQPQNEMLSITALSYVDEKDENLCPSIGVFDEDDMHLRKGYVNKEEGYYKGIELSGVCQEIQPVKIYICYYNQENKKIEKYLEVIGHEVR